jgi:hypothetical protein
MLTFFLLISPIPATSPCPLEGAGEGGCLMKTLGPGKDFDDALNIRKI